MMTDYVLGSAAIIFAVLLPRNQKAARLWSVGFMLAAIAAFLGGSYHGFALRALWNVTIFCIGMSGGFMISGVIASSIGRRDQSTRWLLIGVAITLVGFAIQQSGIANHNDIFHMMQIGALYSFFRGARLLT